MNLLSGELAVYFDGWLGNSILIDRLRKKSGDLIFVEVIDYLEKENEEFKEGIRRTILEKVEGDEGIQMAAELLKDGEEIINQVSMEIGFEDDTILH